ncbi:MAG TPA: di-trans,poly-cis-decaprenylcistransferase, partial [Firmicutes bacterium]|nr:di-trans,poly-cis-decaprenylcistransferase [Bacillota bacterium]
MDQIDIAKRLTHITFIMDGNGRWAKERNKSRSYGHRAGVKRIRPIVDECFFKYGINTVSLFVFSKENWKRDKKEISYLFSLLKAFFKTNIKDLIEKGVRMHVSGDLEDERIPPSVKKVILDAIKLSENNDKFHFNILFN